MAETFSIIKALRRLVGAKGNEPGVGAGIFPIGQSGGAQGIFYAQSWEFQKLWTVVYGNPTGYRCVEAVASNLSKPPWLVLPKDMPWPQHGHEDAIKSHPLLDLLNQPNPSTSGTAMQRSIGRDLELCGKAFWVKVPDSFGRAQTGSLRRLPPQRVTVVGNQDDELMGFVYTDRAGQRAGILPEDVVYLRYPHPERLYDGMAPALVAGLPAETDTASARFNRDLIHNDAAMPGYLIVPGLSQDQFAEWKREWEAGANPGRTRFMGADDAKYVKVGQTNQELTYNDLRRSSQDDILRAFGVPRAVAFDTADTTYANADAERAMFMQQNILPKWVLIADELTQQLGSDMHVRIAFDLAGIDELQDTRDAIVDRAIKLMGYKAQTINEFRSSMGWPPVPWGDEPMAPLQPMSAVPLQPGGVNAPPPPAALPKPQNTQPEPPPPPSPNGKAAAALELTEEGDAKALELAAGRGAVTDTSVPEGKVGDVRARHLIRYYNEGADGQIPWGSPGDFAACVRVAGKHLREPKGFCAERHHDVLGIWPATHAKETRAAEGKK